MWKRCAGVDDPTNHLPAVRCSSDENTCPVCGVFYVQNLREDQIAHGKYHARAMAVLNPKPSSKIAIALERGEDPTVVVASSPRWMHRAMFDRAYRLSREQNYRTLWDESGRVGSDVVGHLLLDDTGMFGPTTIAGAAGFRYAVWTDPQPRWILEWVWIMPKLRSRGILSRAWPAFRQRYGEFPVERPLTAAMERFVDKRSQPNQLYLEGFEPDSSVLNKV